MAGEKEGHQKSILSNSRWLKPLVGISFFQGCCGDSEDNMTEGETLENRRVSNAGKGNRTFEGDQEVIQQ